MNKDILWAKEEDRLRYESRYKEVVRDGWTCAYDTPPKHGQDVKYTFPEMGNNEFIGKFDIDSKFIDIDGNEFDIGHDMHTFYSKHGYLGSKDVFWKPLENK